MKSQFASIGHGSDYEELNHPYCNPCRERVGSNGKSQPLREGQWSPLGRRPLLVGFLWGMVTRMRGPLVLVGDDSSYDEPPGSYEE